MPLDPGIVGGGFGTGASYANPPGDHYFGDTFNAWQPDLTNASPGDLLIYDKSPQKNILVLRGTAAVSSSVQYQSQNTLYMGATGHAIVGQSIEHYDGYMDYLIEFSVRFESKSTRQILLKIGGLTVSHIGSLSRIYFNANMLSSDEVLEYSNNDHYFDFDPVLNQFYNFAIMRSGAVWYIFIDGKQVSHAGGAADTVFNPGTLSSTDSEFPDSALSDSTAVISLGDYNDVYKFDGYLANIRYHLGHSVYDAPTLFDYTTQYFTSPLPIHPSPPPPALNQLLLSGGLTNSLFLMKDAWRGTTTLYPVQTNFKSPRRGNWAGYYANGGNIMQRVALDGSYDGLTAMLECLRSNQDFASPTATGEVILETLDTVDFSYTPSGPFPEGGGDSNWANRELLLHFEGTDEDTTTTDSGPNTVAVTLVNGAKIDNGQARYGSTSMFLDGGNDYLNIPDNSNFEFTNQMFKIEMSVYMSNISVARTFASKYTTTGNQREFWWLYDPNLFSTMGYRPNGGMRFYYSTNGSTAKVFGIPWSPSINTWYDIAVERDQYGVIRFWVDGTVIWEGYMPETLFAGTAPFRIGTNGQLANFFSGWIDEVRVTRGIAENSGTYVTSSQTTGAEAINVQSPTPTHSLPDNGKWVPRILSLTIPSGTLGLRVRWSGQTSACVAEFVLRAGVFSARADNNGDFETGDLTGWTAITGTWDAVEEGYYTSKSQQIGRPWEGRYSMGFRLGPAEINQTITIPNGFQFGSFANVFVVFGGYESLNVSFWLHLDWIDGYNTLISTEKISLNFHFKSSHTNTPFSALTYQPFGATKLRVRVVAILPNTVVQNSNRVTIDQLKVYFCTRS